MTTAGKRMVFAGIPKFVCSGYAKNERELILCVTDVSERRETETEQSGQGLELSRNLNDDS